MYKNIFLPASLMAGAIIGAGMFSLPYVFSQVNLTVGIFYLFILTIVVIAIHLFYADIILNTDGNHNFIGYTKIYLGTLPSQLAVLMAVAQMLIVLAIYLTLASQFINLLFGHLNNYLPIILFWGLASWMIFSSLNKIAKIDFLILLGMVAVVVVIFILGWRTSFSVNFFTHPLFNNNWFLLAGPILFALAGRIGVSEVVRYGGSIYNIKRSIILGTIFSAIIYLLFIFGVLFLSNPVTEDGLMGLVGHIPLFLLSLLVILGLMKIWTSYVAVGFDINWNLISDLKWSSKSAMAVVVLLPLLIYLWNVAGVIFLISLVGGFFLALEGIFIVLMWLRLKKRGRYLVALLIFLIFSAVLIHEVQKVLLSW